MRQAVVLAGGRGMRLRPLTDNIPKPMAQVGGRPFLSILLDQLSRFGVSETLLLAGYLSDVIVEGLPEITPNGMSVKVIATDSGFSEGERLLDAARYLDSIFLLLYGDNLANVSLKELQELALKSSKSVLSVYKKTPGNVELDERTLKVKYLDGDRSDSAQYVEVGYAAVRRADVIGCLREDPNLRSVYSKLSLAGMLLGAEFQHPYFSISDPERLGKLQMAVERSKVIFLDRDGVINRKPPRWSYVTSPSHLDFIDDSISSIKQLAKEGFSFVIVSNQAGVGRKVMSENDLEAVNQTVLDFLNGEGISVLGMYCCTHDWAANCRCRKPQLGLFFQASAELGIFLDGLFMVGDSMSDVNAARNAQMYSALISTEPDLSGAAHISASRFSELVKPISDHYDWLSSVTPPRFGISA